LDAEVWAIVEGVLRDPAPVTAEIMRRQTSTSRVQETLEAYDQRISGIERQQKNLANMTALIDDPEAINPFAEKAQELASKRKELEVARERILEEAGEHAKLQEQLSNFQRWCEAFTEYADELSYEQKRLALYALEVEATVYHRSNDMPYTVALGPKDRPGKRVTIQAPGAVREVARCVQMPL
jgi:hypothetical protein